MPITITHAGRSHVIGGSKPQHQSLGITPRTVDGLIPMAWLQRFKNAPRHLVRRAERAQEQRRIEVTNRLDAILRPNRKPMSATRRRLALAKLDKIVAEAKKERLVAALRSFRDKARNRPQFADKSRECQEFIDATPAHDRTHVAKLYKAWNAFDRRFFNGSLKVPAIELASLGSSLGTCQTRRDGTTRIRMAWNFFHVRHDDDIASFGNTASERWQRCLTTLLHEQIHQQLQEQNLCDSHGPEFTKIANRIGSQLGVPRHEAKSTGANASSYWPNNRLIPELVRIAGA